MFNKTLILFTIISAFTVHAGSKVLITTNLGNIEVELNDEKAPISSKNFLDYINSGFYSDTTFHRIIPGFMIQGGGYTANMQEKKTQAPIKNEANNGLKNKRGTLAMARTNEIDSATSQFFINVADNSFLDYTPQNFGYAVFGKVTQGMDVVDKIVAQPTEAKSGHQDVPKQAIIIESMKVIK